MTNYSKETIENYNEELEALLAIDIILSAIDENDKPSIHLKALYKEIKFILNYHSINLENTKKILKSIIRDYQSIIRNN